ncbi:DUF2155 domain-containing protein [Rickettsiales bacterium]|nr:DUF2155 domain-containing protein [Rickettsiales bacterium]
MINFKIKYLKYKLFLCLIPIFLSSPSYGFDLKFNKIDQNQEDQLEIKKIKEKSISKTDNDRFFDTAILQSLNKITAVSSKLEIEVGDKIKFGKVDIKVYRCWRSPAYERPENKILLEISSSDSKKDSNKILFYGWMLSSSPSISGLEHPIYDIVALECVNKQENENQDE